MLSAEITMLKKERFLILGSSQLNKYESRSKHKTQCSLYTILRVLQTLTHLNSKQSYGVGSIITLRFTDKDTETQRGFSNLPRNMKDNTISSLARIQIQNVRLHRECLDVQRRGVPPTEQLIAP